MLTVTEAASRKLGEVIQQQQAHGSAVFGLRISAGAGCCSGPQYGMELASEPAEGDWVGEFGGIKVLVDSDSAALLEGVSIDYIETLQQSGFTITSPRDAAAREGGCGCGSGGCGCGGH
jgi:iron-sulfur cluster assembly accessory protein